MKKTITRDEIKNTLAAYYRDLYDKLFQLQKEGTAALHDGDHDAFKAISRRAQRKSDFTDGIKAAADMLGIGNDEFMEAVNQDRAAQPETAEGSEI